MELIIALLMLVLASIMIHHACNSFENASNFLGRKMSPGVKGATINAVGSSLPELFTAIILLFFYKDQGGFSAGIATTAGSAVFNTVVIPMLCIMVVCYRGIKSSKGYKKVTSIEICKSNMARDAVFLLVAEIALIFFLGGGAMAWWMGGGLILIYVAYFRFLMMGFGQVEAEEFQQEISDEKKAPFKALVTFDFNQLIYKGKAFTQNSAWVVLSLSVIAVSIACYVLAEAVMVSADALGVPAYFTAVVFAAAASSVPDTILSVKDAARGDYDDALSNALGSNVFDICVALGLPLLVYGLMYGDVSLEGAESASIQILRIVLVGVTVIVLMALLLQKHITVKTAWFFGLIYACWLGYIIYTAGQLAGWF